MSSGKFAEWKSDGIASRHLAADFVKVPIATKILVGEDRRLPLLLEI